MDKKTINELCKILEIESDYAEDDVIHSPNHTSFGILNKTVAQVKSVGFLLDKSIPPMP